MWSYFKDPLNCGVHLRPKHIRLIAEAGELLVQFGEFLREILAFFLYRGGSSVPAGVEAPSLQLNLRAGRNLAQPRNVGVRPAWKVLFEQSLASVDGFDAFAAIKAYDVGEKFDLH